MPTVENLQPPPPPSIAGTMITVSAYLNNPGRVERLIQNLVAQRFIADVIFGTGPTATGGAVVFDQVSENDLFLSRDVQEIAPGGEFPILNDAAPVPMVAGVAKWGGRVKVSDEARDRNSLNLFARETTKLRNTIIRKVDTVAIATLDAAPTLTTTGADWTNPATDILGFLANLRPMVDGLDMGYVLDTLVINPIQGAELRGRQALASAFSEASRDALVRNGTIGKLQGFDIIESNRVAAGTARAVARKQVGGISDEVPLQTKTYRSEPDECSFIQGSRRVVPYVTDPLAAIKISGI